MAKKEGKLIQLDRVQSVAHSTNKNTPRHIHAEPRFILLLACSVAGLQQVLLYMKFSVYVELVKQRDMYDSEIYGSSG